MRDKSETLPTVSVIMPARNEEKFIGIAIRSVQRQNYPSHLIELIVVDNGSTDNTPQVAEKAGARVLVKRNARVGGVRNEGARHSTSNVIAFLDSDCEANVEWIRKAVELLNSPLNVGAVGGAYCTPANATWVERAWAPNRDLAEQEVNFLACSGIVTTKAMFDGVDGFNEQLEAAEDDDFSRKVRESGKRLLSVPDCAVMHHGYPTALTAIARRQIWHGTNQLESSSGLKDRLLVLTHLFLLGALTAAVGAIVSYWLVAGGLAMIAGVVFVATIGRMFRNQYRDKGIVMFTQLYIVLTFFLTGRSMGLVKNYFRLVTRRSVKVR